MPQGSFILGKEKRKITEIGFGTIRLKATDLGRRILAEILAFTIRRRANELINARTYIRIEEHELTPV